MLSFKLYQMILYTLPSVHRHSLRRLLVFLSKVAENSARAEPNAELTVAAGQLEEEEEASEETNSIQSATVSTTATAVSIAATTPSSSSAPISPLSSPLKGNRMDATNLGKIFGPNLIHDKQDDKSVSLKNVEGYNITSKILQTWIEREKELWTLPAELSKGLSEKVSVLEKKSKKNQQ